ncbi:MAG: zinc ribbon domain-containing protein [Pirellulaceae bacterium]|nr:zinc ribbon domain-containing protein [Pirellulaceae bacterium]
MERNQNVIRFRCPQCGSPLKAMVTRVGHELTCPHCGTEVEVPDRDAASSTAAEPPAPPASKPAELDAPVVPAEPSPGPPEDEYAIRGMTYAIREPSPDEHSGPVVPVVDLPDEYEAPGRRPDRVWEEDEVKPLDERPKLPPRPMVDGVFRIFGQMSVILCWFVLSIMSSVVLGIAYYAIVLGSVDRGEGAAAAPSWVGSVLLAGVATISSLLIMVVANAYLMAILNDSAAGNARVENWPDVLFLTWATDALFLIASLCVPFLVALALAYPLGGLLAGAWWIGPPCYWLLFPIALLSTLEMQSPLVPVSPVVVQSLWHCGRTWGVFYLETAVLGGTLLFAGFCFHAAGFMNFAGVAILGGLATFAAMLYFRLLGRVAWVCDERFRELRAENEAGEDDDEGEFGDTTPSEIRPTPVDDF